MANLESPLKEQVEELRNLSFTLFMEKKYEEESTILIQAWDLLPEPKIVYDESFHIATYLVDNYITLNKLLEAKKWSEILFECNKERYDSGEREYKAGKVAFEMGEYEKAKEYFAIGDKKSKGRIWKRGDALEYFKFYKGK